MSTPLPTLSTASSRRPSSWTVYPIEPPTGKAAICDEDSVGLVQVFLETGHEVVASPTLRRRVVRRRLDSHTDRR